MAEIQYQLAPGVFVNETAEDEYQIAPEVYVNETVSAPPAGGGVNKIIGGGIVV